MEKYFTVEQANHALALVRPIVSDILKKMEEAQRLHEEVKAEKAVPAVSEESLLSKITAAEKLLNQIEYHMRELESVGVYLKDLKLGIVDFPCYHNGQIINLCWMVSEPSVTFWHETDRGFSSRKPIDESFALGPKVANV